MRKSTKSHWDNYWSSEYHQSLVVHEELVKNLLAVLDVKGKKTLEIGGGMGGDSFVLAKKGANAYILDYSKKALDQAVAYAKKQKINIHPIEADAYHIPLNDESVDVILHQGFLEHFRDPLVLLQEQARILRKGGIIVVDVPQKYTTYTIKKHIQIAQGKWFAGWETQFSIDELKKIVEEAGFEIVRSYGWGYYGKLQTLKDLKLGKWYEKLWNKIESSKIKLYLTWCIGVVAKK